MAYGDDPDVLYREVGKWRASLLRDNAFGYVRRLILFSAGDNPKSTR